MGSIPTLSKYFRTHFKPNFPIFFIIPPPKGAAAARYVYIVSNDQGIHQIMGHLYQDGDPQLYLRPNDLFIATVDAFCRTARRPMWEQRIYEKVA